jgi:hypothetical protein
MSEVVPVVVEVHDMVHDTVPVGAGGGAVAVVVAVASSHIAGGCRPL